MRKHCTNCNGFAWWDGDYCCTKKMAIIEQSPNGAFWCPFPQPNQTKFIAGKCEEYEPTDTKHNLYEKQYEEFLEMIKQNGDMNLSVEEFYAKYYNIA